MQNITICIIIIYMLHVNANRDHGMFIMGNISTTISYGEKISVKIYKNFH